MRLAFRAVRLEHFRLEQLSAGSTLAGDRRRNVLEAFRHDGRRAFGPPHAASAREGMEKPVVNELVVTGPLRERLFDLFTQVYAGRSRRAGGHGPPSWRPAFRAAVRCSAGTAGPSRRSAAAGLGLPSARLIVALHVAREAPSATRAGQSRTA